MKHESLTFEYCTLRLLISMSQATSTTRLVYDGTIFCHHHHSGEIVVVVVDAIEVKDVVEEEDLEHNNMVYEMVTLMTDTRPCWS
jgi:hypothetical protein